jgi:predicted HAD superfamily Cof-like phosphohydrolase
MNPEQKSVLEFMRTFQQPIEVYPKIPPEEVQTLAYALIREELSEFKEAMNNKDLIACADAIGDLLYVVYWAANAFGFDAQPVFNEIHQSNMTKIGGKKDPDTGKLIKPTHYSPPNIAGVLKPW